MHSMQATLVLIQLQGVIHSSLKFEILMIKFTYVLFYCKLFCMPCSSDCSIPRKDEELVQFAFYFYFNKHIFQQFPICRMFRTQENYTFQIFQNQKGCQQVYLTYGPWSRSVNCSANLGFRMQGTFWITKNGMRSENLAQVSRIFS